jgi:hypothetical protein
MAGQLVDHLLARNDIVELRVPWRCVFGTPNLVSLSGARACYAVVSWQVPGRTEVLMERLCSGLDAVVAAAERM